MPNPTPKRETPFDVRSFARSFAPMSVRQIAVLAQKAESESTRLAACIHLLDRGYGKAEQSHELNADIQITIRQILDSPTQPVTIDVTPASVDQLPHDKVKAK